MRLRAVITVPIVTLAAVALPVGAAGSVAAPAEATITLDGRTLQQVRVPRSATPVTGAGETRSDFDGDGRDDIAAGAASVWTGGGDRPDGLSAPVIVKYSSAAFSEYLAVVDGTTAFGAATASGDFDGDGFDDLAVGDPQEVDLGSGGAGGVWIVPGGRGGLDLRRARHFNQSSPGVGGNSMDNDVFGFSLAAGDLNGDGRDDLAIGAPYKGEASGMVVVLLGTPSGLSATGSWTLGQGPPWTPGEGWYDDKFGYALAIGRVNDNAYADLVISSIGEGADGRSGGMVTLIWGNPAGLNQTGATSVQAGELTNGGRPFHLIGSSLAIADTNRDRLGEVLVGAPSAQVGDADRAGLVVELPGRATGLSAAGARYHSQATAGVPGAAEAGDAFGSALAAGDVTGDGYGDVLVGVPGESSGATAASGAVVLLKGSAAGLTGTGAQFFDQNSASVPDTAEPGDRFGATVAVLDMDGTGPLDAVVGAPGEILNGVDRAGRVIWFHGGAGGLAPQGLSWAGQDFNHSGWAFVDYPRSLASTG